MKPLFFKPLFVLSFITFSFFAKAQIPTVQDCLGAIPLCEPVYYEEDAYEGTGNYENEINDGASCLSSGEKNDVWYIFTVQQAGELSFTITPNVWYDDYDWAVYNLTNANCDDIATMPELEVSCNYSADDGDTGPNGGSTFTHQDAGGTPFNATIPVEVNDIYVINVSQWSTSTNGYTIDFSESTADIYDNVPPIMLNVNSQEYCDSAIITCHFNENILCNTVSPEDFQIFGPGGPFTVTEVRSYNCELGAEYGIDYEILFNPPLQMGTYTLYLEPSEPGVSVTDNCGNSAEIGIANFATQSSYDIVFDNTDASCNGYSDGIIDASLDTPEGVTVEYELGEMINSTGIFTNLPGGTYTVTAITSTGCDAQNETEIINPPQAFANAGEDSVICGFPNFQLEALESPVGTGTWTSSTPEVGFENENIYNTTATLPFGIHTLTWTVDNGICGTFTDEVTLTRYPTNTLAGDDDGTCELTDYQLEGNNPFPGTGIWTCATAGVTFDNASVYNTMAHGITGGSHTFTWQTDYGICGTLSDQVVITNSSLPTPATVETEEQTICLESINIQGNEAIVGTGEWTTQSGATIISQNSAFTLAENLAEGENKFYWTITNGYCPPEIDSVSIFRDLQPTTAEAGENIETCEDFATLSANTPEIGTGLWQANGSQNFLNETVANTDVYNLALGENFLTWTISNGVCEPSVSQIIITRHETLTIAEAGDNQEICNLNTNLQANTITAGIGTWSSEGIAIIASPNDPNSAVQFLEIGENIFVWTVSGDHCEGSTDTVRIFTDAEPPTPQTASLPQIVEQCEILSIIPPTATDNCAGELTATTSSPLSHTEQGTYEITWTYTDQNGNQTTQTQLFVVQDDTNPTIACDSLVSVQIDTSDQNRIYINETEILDPTETGDNCEVLGIINSYNNLGTLNGEEFEIGENIIVWTITDIANNKSTCETKLLVEIDPRDWRDCDEDGIPNFEDTDHCVVVPEAISPNGNGKNDILIIEGLEQFPNNELKIFNRWGNKVYQASPYTNDWDGTNMFGATIGNEKLPVGTYYYTLYLDETYKQITGFIYIVE